MRAFVFVAGVGGLVVSVGAWSVPAAGVLVSVLLILYGLLTDDGGDQ